MKGPKMKKKIPGIKEVKTCYIYLLKNCVNAKCYIGYTEDIDRRIKEHESLARTGSKLQIHKAIRKHGIESFSIHILYMGSDPETCLNEKEPFFINQYDSFKKGYNATLGGENPQLGRIMITDGVSNKLIETSEEIPVGWRIGLTTDRSSLIGSQPITNGIENRRLRKGVDIPEGWRKGYTHRNPSKPIFDGVNIRHIPHGEPVPENWIIGTGKKPPNHTNCLYITNGSTNRRLFIGLPVPQGWKHGFTKRSSKQPITNGSELRFIDVNDVIPEGWNKGNGTLPPNHKGHICITNGKINRTIPRSENIPDGWRRGRLKKKKDGTYKSTEN